VRLFGVSLVMLSLVGCAAQETYVRVKNVKVVGAKGVKEKNVIEGLATHDPTGFIWKDYAEYDEVSVAKDRDRIESFYQHEGYFSAHVTKVDVKKLSEKDVEVTFTVDEGEPSRIEAIDLEGMPPKPPEAQADAPLDELILVKKGEIYKQADYLATKDNLKGYVVRQGYAYGDVDGTIEVDRDKHQAVVRLKVDPGPLTKFGPTKVVGLKRLPESAIRNRIDWEEGERYDPRKVERTKGRLYQLGFLSSVRIDVPKEGKPEVAEMTIRAREGLRHELTLGGGGALDNNNYIVRPRFGYAIKGIWDPLITLSFDARPGFIIAGQGKSGQFAGEVSTTLTRDDFLFPRLKGTTSIVAEAIELETYAARGLRGKLGVERPFFGDKVQLGFGYQFRLINFTDVSALISPDQRDLVGLPQAPDVQSFKLNYKLGYFDQLIVADFRDNPLNTRNGAYFELRLEESGLYSGSGFTYVKATPEARGFWAPWSFLGFAAKLRYGTSTTDKLPITQRFFSGGANDHRGFTYRRLSPMSDGADDSGHRVPIGGNTLLETSFETRLDLFELLGNWVGLVAFVDGGDVTLTTAELDIGNLHWAAGLGLRYNTLVGPIRFDVGYRLNRFGEGEPDPGKRFAFHLSLGQAF
jgi:translocation and assembly module TamA